MTKQTRSRILIVLCAPFLLAALLLLVLNVYLQSAHVKNKLASALYDAIGIDAKISRISYTPWGGVQLGGVRVAGDEGRPDLLSAPVFSAKISLPSVFGRDIVIDEVKVQSPRVSLSPGVKFKKPKPLRAEKEPASEIPSVPASSQETAVTPAKAPRTTTVHQAMVRDGELVYENKKNRQVIFLQGISVDSDLSLQPDVSGDLFVEKITLAEALFINKLQSPFHFSNNTLQLPAISAEIAGGTMEGNFRWEEANKESPAELILRFKDAELREFARGVDFAADRFSGKLDGSVTLRGNPSEPKSINGAGKLNLEGGKFEQIEILQTLGDALKIEEFSVLILEKANIAYKIRDGRIKIDLLELHATNMKLEAAGYIKEDGVLDLKAKLFLNRKLLKKLPSFARSSLEAVDDEYSAVDFDITGTLSNPDSNLLKRLIGDNLNKEVNRVFKSFFGGDKETPTTP